MEDFLKEHASAIFALLGAFLGGFLSFLASWAMKNREYTLRIWDRLLDRRIKAHENLITIALEMRVMVALGGKEEDGEVARSPQVLTSREVFEEWFTRFIQLASEGSTWITTKSKREVNFVQDYLITLHTNLAEVPSDKYPAIGQVIRQDFIHLSSELEKLAFDYFENEISKKKLNRLSEWHKYPRQVTESRLSSTALLSKWESVQKAVGKSGRTK